MASVIVPTYQKRVCVELRYFSLFLAKESLRFLGLELFRNVHHRYPQQFSEFYFCKYLNKKRESYILSIFLMALYNDSRFSISKCFRGLDA